MNDAKTTFQRLQAFVRDAGIPNVVAVLVALAIVIILGINTGRAVARRQ